MFNLFYAGGPFFMGLLTLLLAAIVWSKLRAPHHVRTLGRLALTMGFLALMIGLFQLFEAVEAQDVDIHPALLAGGLKNAIVAPLYGALIYIFSTVLQLVSSN